jgi:hypothetical protein
MPNRHSGIVIVTCADWAYHPHHAAEFEKKSRIKELVQMAVHDEANPDHILPHILRTEAPALVVGEPTRRAMFMGANPAVLGGAKQVWVDGHSQCAGILARFGLEAGSDQFPVQRQLMEEGAALDFANLLAISAHHPVRITTSYTEYGKPGEVLRVRDICTVSSTVAFD